MSERVDQMRAMKASGMTNAAIAARVGLSSARVGHLIAYGETTHTERMAMRGVGRDIDLSGGWADKARRGTVMLGEAIARLQAKGARA